jgi:hypothetical protein
MYHSVTFIIWFGGWLFWTWQQTVISYKMMPVLAHHKGHVMPVVQGD